MEIKELVSFYINESSQTLDVTFRTLLDSDDEIRTSQIEFSEIKNFGYDVLLNKIDEFEDLIDEDEINYDDFDYDDFDDLYDDEELEDEVISFLNEYYLINTKNLPPSEFF
jgi:hypothetical protein